MSPSTKSSSNGHQVSTTEHLFAGTIAGSFTTIALYPLDLIKVRYQVHEGVGPAYTSISSAFATIVSKEGVHGLYQGAVPALLASAASWGGYFYFYENAKQRKLQAYSSFDMTSSSSSGSSCNSNNNNNSGSSSSSSDNSGCDEKHSLGSIDNYLAGIEAGCIMVFLTNPFWLIKTRLQIQGTQKAITKQYRGFLDALITIPREEGFLGLYKGIIPALLLTSHGAIQFTVYEYLKKFSAQLRAPQDRHKQPAAVSMIIGGISKIVAATVTYPYQVVKSRLQQREALPLPEQIARNRKTRAKYTGTIDCLQKIYINEGFKGYFKGAVPNILRVAPSAALTLLVYEEALKLISSDSVA